MCGRYVIRTATPEIARLLGVETRADNTPARYNVAPTQPVPAARLDDDGTRCFAMLRWGLVPFWSKDGKSSYATINARAETIASKPTFRQSFRRRRCLLAADGYYEWRKEADRKQPYFIAAADGGMLVFAGVWDRWRSRTDDTCVDSCAIVTTAANDDVRELHDRMPVIVPPAAFAAWLDRDTDADALTGIMTRIDPGALRWHAVSTYVNNVRNEGEQCIAPLAA